MRSRAGKKALTHESHKSPDRDARVFLYLSGEWSTEPCSDAKADSCASKTENTRDSRRVRYNFKSWRLHVILRLTEQPTSVTKISAVKISIGASLSFNRHHELFPSICFGCVCSLHDNNAFFTQFCPNPASSLVTVNIAYKQEDHCLAPHILKVTEIMDCSSLHSPRSFLDYHGKV